VTEKFHAKPLAYFGRRAVLYSGKSRVATNERVVVVIGWGYARSRATMSAVMTIRVVALGRFRWATRTIGAFWVTACFLGPFVAVRAEVRIMPVAEENVADTIRTDC
jgi:hypothetical protein